ncbi:hypothetical protein CPB83DRAFT_921224 [Crepidotus variabilis]|uniref:Meiotically up-regulated protein Msb1/Mug8 domain-containing protein n=1 Tax=Crepidotus variabilis TaxID=179855 RepID=A0A9P6EJF9_9AGAR|nr:hypothetical protein CPB83DRAFT_921224 [Crepidotus variabilis]
MTSLFSRARTKSTPHKSNTFHGDGNGVGHSDEFGRVPSRTMLVTPSKKDKKKEQKRSKTGVSTREEELVQEPVFPDGAFLPLNLERPKKADATVAATPPVPEPPTKDHDYGYLSYERHVVLGLEQLERLVEVVSEELETRGGITTPFIFSNTALDISSSAIKRLIRAFLNTCEPYSGYQAQEAEMKWREEARFAGPHELGMCLRWGLARVIRSVAGQDVRGLVSWEHYLEFRESEAVLGYPSTHFATNFLPTLTPSLQAIIIRLLSLLTRLVANSTSSGHTPPTLSPLFAPLFFGLGPATLTFHHAYIHYLRAVNAMEHLILSFIRWQDTPRASANGGSTSSAATLGVPVRLKEWIKGYPATLPILDNKKPQPRRGARTTRVMSVRRNVRMYSPDLVKTASTWAHRAPGSTTNGLANSKEWDRIAPATLKMTPRYSETYKKRMVMPPNFNPDLAPGTVPSMSPSSSQHPPAMSQSALLPDTDYFGLSGREGEDRFRSLTDLKWGEFESLGFNDTADDKKLQFDLTESARTERKTKRQTLNWNDFSSDGFTRMDAPLSATLQFSKPFTATISSWPTHNAEMTKKLKKTQKALPAFGWDTEPVVGSEEVIEEAFVDVFCDLIYGGGWMDLERGEVLDRDCNWALVQYKALPPSRTTISGNTDPRTSSTLILFEEFVPLEYREQLAVKSSNRRRLPSLFSSGTKKQWKQAATLNGRPYVVGHVPVTPSPREVEFDGLLHGNNSTRMITLNPKISTNRMHAMVPPLPADPPPKPPFAPMIREPTKSSPTESPPTPRPAKSDEMHSDIPGSPSIKKSLLFKVNRKSMIPAEYSTVDFETRMASYSDDERNGSYDEPDDIKQKRRESNADAWVDILVGSQDRRMGGQDAILRRSPRHDPDMVSQEVAQVLAAVPNRSPSPPSVMERMDQDYGMDQHFEHFDRPISDTDVVEVEHVPRGGNTRSIPDSEDASVTQTYDETASATAGDLDSPDEPDDDATPSVLKAREMLRQQRRLGYFDLHPERRQTQAQSIADDPRAKFANESDDEEQDDDDDIYGPPEVVRPLPAPPAAAAPKPPAPQPPTINTLPITPLKISPKPVVPSPIDPVQTTPETNGSPTALNGVGKTAALIEMYRERERGNVPPKPIVVNGLLPVTPIVPSRLPVRSSSLNATETTANLTPSPPKEPSPKESSPESEPEPLNTEVPRIPFEETGRASPGRYIHGAPLHNVLEEEEEE